MFAEQLGALTGRKDLAMTTWRSWNAVIPNIRLLRKERAWCPDCFQEARESNGAIYEPLIWATKPVEICSLHRKYLSTQCPHCKVSTQTVLNRKTWSGYCCKCGNWLGSSNINDGTRVIKKEDMVRLEWITRCVGALIAAGPKLERKPERHNVMEGIVKCVKEHCDGNIAQFAHVVGVPKNTAWTWYHGQALPSLEMLMAICGCFAIDIVKLLSEGQIVTIGIDPFLKSYSKVVKRPRKKRLLAIPTSVESELKSIARSKLDLAPSMAAVAKKIQNSKRLLYKHYPDLCKQISQNYRQRLRYQRLSE